MSALGHKQMLDQASEMSALPTKADMRLASRNVRKVPIADVRVFEIGLIRSHSWPIPRRRQWSRHRATLTRLAFRRWYFQGEGSETRRWRSSASQGGVKQKSLKEAMRHRLRAATLLGASRSMGRSVREVSVIIFGSPRTLTTSARVCRIS